MQSRIDSQKVAPGGFRAMLALENCVRNSSGLEPSLLELVKDVQSHLRHSRADTTANEYMQELPESVQQMVGTVYAMLTLTATEQQVG